MLLVTKAMPSRVEFVRQNWCWKYFCRWLC